MNFELVCSLKFIVIFYVGNIDFVLLNGLFKGSGFCLSWVLGWFCGGDEVVVNGVKGVCFGGVLVGVGICVESCVVNVFRWLVSFCIFWFVVVCCCWDRLMIVFNCFCIVLRFRELFVVVVVVV